MVVLIAAVLGAPHASSTLCGFRIPSATNQQTSRQFILEIATQQSHQRPQRSLGGARYQSTQSSPPQFAHSIITISIDSMAIFSRTSTQSHMHTSESPVSVASSWADTDCESDSDNESGSYTFFGNKHTRKTAHALKHIQLRTAPISIPQATHTVRSRSSLHFEESLPQQHGGEAYGRNSMDGLEIDEEDLMLFGNLAYLRTQHGDMSGFRQRSSVLSDESAPSDEDEQIFELEM